MLCLAAALQLSGNLPLRPASVPAVTSANQSAPPGAASMPDLGNIPKAPPLEPPPSGLPQIAGAQTNAAAQATTGAQTTAAAKTNAGAEASRGEADRLSAEDHPIVPISGADAAKLADTFKEVRDGHKHEALDISAPRGTPVRAAVEGNVVKLFNSKAGGLTVYQFDDSGKLCYYYAHLERYAPNLKEGALLRQGDILGYVGTSGDVPANAPHLHFAVFRLGPDKKWYHGTAIDPLPMLR
jgi:murein DD-endopeptidase MepM/ murein hydrolase activator NlpD